MLVVCVLCGVCLVAQSCPTLGNPMDCSLPGSSIHGNSPGKNTGVVNSKGLNKEIQPVHSEGDQPWDFFGRNDAKAETPVLWPPHAKS